MPSVLLISGSPTHPSKAAALLAYASQRLQAQGAETHSVSVLDFPAEDLIQGKYNSPAFSELKALLADASGVIIATPIYKASYTGSLKALLDILPQHALEGKTILPLATAGTLAHLLAIDYALKPVLSVLGASDIQQGVYIVETLFKHNEDGTFTLEGDLQERFDSSIDRLAATVTTLSS